MQMWCVTVFFPFVKVLLLSHFPSLRKDLEDCQQVKYMNSLMYKGIFLNIV